MSSKTIAFDLDDVLCVRTSNVGDIEKYKSCKPIDSMIALCNQCHAAGYKVVIFTARGMSTQKGDVHSVYSKLYELTIKQLSAWGVKYDQLVMGKIHYDVLIDDKALNSEDVDNLNTIIQRVENGS
mgnify:FL=1